MVFAVLMALVGCIVAACWYGGAPRLRRSEGGSQRAGELSATRADGGTELGSEAVVLPGFTPLSTSGTEVRPGGRRYRWERSFLPVEIDSQGRPLTGPLELAVRLPGGAMSKAVPEVRVAESAADHVVVTASALIGGTLEVGTVTRVEYDGVALTSLNIVPREPTEVDRLDFEVDVVATPAMRMLAFDATSIRRQGRAIRVDPEYRGPFLNVIGLADGDRSFWWFADDAVGWIWNGDTVTEVNRTGSGWIHMRQRLIGSRFRIAEPVHFAFNFLATPVRDLGAAWRRERVAVGPLDLDASRVGKFHLWWPDAFPYQFLPYTTPPPGLVPEALSKTSYPGVEATRRELARWLELGIHGLPYFSAHVLSELDPELRRHRADWEVAPPFAPPTAPVT